MLGKCYFLHCVLLTLFVSFSLIHSEETLSELSVELKDTQNKLKETQDKLMKAEQKFTEVTDSLRKDIERLMDEQLLCKFI